MVGMRTTEPIDIEDLKLRPGHIRAKVISEVVSGKARGTRRAVKVSVMVGKKLHIGWASREWFKLDSIYKAKGISHDLYHKNQR